MPTTTAQRRDLAGKILRFLIVGGLAFVVDASVLSALVWLGATPYAGRIASVAVAIVFTWWLNRRMTFRVGTPATWNEFRNYVVQSLLGAALNYGIFAAGIAIGLDKLVALAISSAAVSVVNFIRYRAIFESSAARVASPD